MEERVRERVGVLRLRRPFASEWVACAQDDTGVGSSGLAPDVFKIVEAFLVCQPFDRSNGPFSEAATRFGVVAKVDCVVGRIQDYFVHSDGIAFAERGDFDLRAGCVPDNLLQRSRRSRY